MGDPNMELDSDSEGDPGFVESLKNIEGKKTTNLMQCNLLTVVLPQSYKRGQRRRARDVRDVS